MKIAVIYATTTGNTQAMAEAILKGAQAAGADATLFTAADISADEALKYDMLLLGSPAQGAEELDEVDMEPLFSSLEGSLSDKKVGLFGSYDWGDGEWIRTWEDRVRDAGGKLYKEGLIANLAPGDDDIESCEKFGAEAAAF